jgi:hypothetical protein
MGAAGLDADAFRPLLLEAIELTPRKARAADRRVGASRLGGAPDLPRGFAWPERDGFALEHVGQLSLDGLASRGLPAGGLLSFFVHWDLEADARVRCAVLHFEGNELAPTTRRGPAPQGFDLSPRLELPPYRSMFVSAVERAHRPLVGDARAGAPVIALEDDELERYTEVYERWLTERGDGPMHGMFGYDRPMECEQQADEVMLLRLDSPLPSVDLLAAACLYFLAPRTARGDVDLARARAYYGPAI